MPDPAVDDRSPERRARDEQIAAEPQHAPPELPPDAVALSLEEWESLRNQRLAALKNILRLAKAHSGERLTRDQLHERR